MCQLEIRPHFDTVSGWKKIDGEWYYFDTTGMDTYPTMYTGWLTYKGHRYYLASDGHMLRGGYYVIDGVKYYFDENGIESK